jgi:hypothetical protein
LLRLYTDGTKARRRSVTKEVLVENAGARANDCLRAGSYTQKVLSALLRCVKTFRDPLASSLESAMGLVWGRQRDDPESNMGYRPAKMKPVTGDRSGSGGRAGGRRG